MSNPPPFTLTPRPAALVRFDGLRAREGALTLGQLNILQWINDAPEPLDATIGNWLVFPDGTRVADVVASFATLVARHEGLRTTFDLGGRQQQRVLAAGEFAIEIYEVGPAEPAPAQRIALATELDRRWRPGAACGPGQLPVWVALAVHRGLVHAGYTHLSHLVVDYLAVEVLGRELAELVGDPATREVGAPRHQPLDQAELEHGQKMRRRVERALRHREKLLRQMPPCLYPAARSDEPAESVAVDMRSAAAALALRRLAARTARSRPSAVLAAVCALLSRATGSPTLVFPTLASNRFERHLHSHIGTLVQAAMARVKVGTASFDELVQRVWLAVVTASEHGMYDVDRRNEIDRRVGLDRGVHLSFEPLFNSPVIDVPDDREPPPAGRLREAMAATSLSREPMRSTLSLIRFDLYDYHDVMHLRLWSGDTSRVSVDAAEGMLRALERLLVAAAGGDLDHQQMTRALDLEPLPYGPDWLPVDSGWVELAEVQRLLDEALAPARVQIFAELDGRQLVAYVAASESLRTPEQAHARCMAALPGRHTAMAPRHYVLCGIAPDDPTDLAGWQSVVGEGPGRIRTDAAVPRAARQRGSGSAGGQPVMARR
jgi:hypothetical protein